MVFFAVSGAGLSLLSPAHAAPAEPCDRAFGPGARFAIERAVRRSTTRDCHLDDVTIAASRATITWRTPKGPLPVTIVPASCHPAERSVGEVAFLGLAALGERCPGAASQLEVVVGQLSGLHEAVGVPSPDRAQPEASLTAELIYARYVLPGFWALLLLALAFALWPRRGLLREPPSGTLLLITVLAVGLRAVLGTFGPGDLYNNLAGAYGGVSQLPGLGLYGGGPDALLAVIFEATGPTDDVPIALSFVMGSLSPAVLAGLSRRLGYGWPAALTAALLLASAPLHVRFSATYNRYIPLVFLALVGWTLLLTYCSSRRRADLFAAMAALVLAANHRPDAFVVPAATLALVVAWRLAGRQVPLPAWGAVGAHLGVLAIPALTVIGLAQDATVTDWGQLAAERRALFDPNHNAFLAAEYTPLVWPVLAVLGLTRAPKSGRWIIAWVAGTALLATAAVCAHPIAGDLASARYHLLPLPLYLILAGAALGPLYPAWATLGALLAAGFAALPMAHVTRMTTLDAEYHWLRAGLAEIPDGCVVVAYTSRGDMGLLPDPTLSLSEGRQHLWRDAWPPSEGPEDPACAVYYRSSACAVAEGADPYRRRPDRVHLCEQMSAFFDRPHSEAQLAADPYARLTYGEDPVPIGLYWIIRGVP